MSPAKRPTRLSARTLAAHLLGEPPAVARLVHALRRTILKCAPGAAEAIKFRVLCYYHPDSFFGALGGNICMIEIKDAPRRAAQPRAVFLSFIHGRTLPDPHGLLHGRLKSKRFVQVPDSTAATSRRVAALIRAAARQRPLDC